ncbi:MAG: sarcosine oxidase subunit beta [Solirubrobacterales bacterium]|jgi:sarcosine oxidase subunit beta|nr:sarcosine oxidase subunit beta [Solirubrobacterales bacterium]
MDALPTHAGVVVVGGGILGTSIAFHLGEAGVRDVVLLERDALAGGSSGKPIGGVRGQFSDALNIRLAARSLTAYDRFAQAFGADIGLEKVGYLFLLRTPEHVSSFEAGMALQQELGIPTRLLSPGEAHDRCPFVDPDAFLAAAFSPSDGHAHPTAVATAYARSARRRGARIVTGCAVSDLEVRGGEVVAVHTSHGVVRTSTVVCAAGPWSRGIGEMAGVALDVHPLRRQIAFTEPLATPAPGLPFTIDYDSTFYFHNAADGVLLGMSDQAQAPGFDRDYTDAWLPMLRAAAARCAPELAELRVRDGWAGLYEMTPDANALVGESPEVGRFLYATGFSGHGFCQAPAVGEVVRDLVLGREPFTDISPLRAERFAENAPVLEANIV